MQMMMIKMVMIVIIGYNSYRRDDRGHRSNIAIFCIKTTVTI